MALSAGCRGRWTRTRRSVPPHNHLVVIACAAVTTSWESTVGATSQVDVAKGPDWVHVGPGDPTVPCMASLCLVQILLAVGSLPLL